MRGVFRDPFKIFRSPLSICYPQQPHKLVQFQMRDTGIPLIANKIHEVRTFYKGKYRFKFENEFWQKMFSCHDSIDPQIRFWCPETQDFISRDIKIPIAMCVKWKILLSQILSIPIDWHHS